MVCYVGRRGGVEPRLGYQHATVVFPPRHASLYRQDSLEHISKTIPPQPTIATDRFGTSSTPIAWCGDLFCRPQHRTIATCRTVFSFNYVGNRSLWLDGYLPADTMSCGHKAWPVPSAGLRSASSLPRNCTDKFVAHLVDDFLPYLVFE